MKYTILGARGFIGSHVAAMAQSMGHDVYTPDRNEDLRGLDLGHVVYSIGVTADFRTRPYDTVTAHVTRLQQILTESRFESLVYLSSTRVYARSGLVTGQPFSGSVQESSVTPVLSDDPGDLYNLTKLLGESIALLSWPRAKIARLSNVLGPDFKSDNFVISVVRDSLQQGRVVLKSALTSAKDYIFVDDVARAILMLSTNGRRRIYNVASGVNTTHGAIVRLVQELTEAEFFVEDGSPEVLFPRIDTSALVTDLDLTFQTVETMIPRLVKDFRSFLSRQDLETAQ
ncbi:MAG TPA: NAD(P)-dependent oxidoreductase [Planctomycetaceae bacterium]|nr:NAD(P)-dependent oxidoreductase [Planctomycetaceae bacterium]